MAPPTPQNIVVCVKKVNRYCQIVSEAPYTDGLIDLHHKVFSLVDVAGFQIFFLWVFGHFGAKNYRRQSLQKKKSSVTSPG